MSSAVAAWLQVGLLIVALGACYVPLGNYIATIFTSENHWRPELRLYKIIGIDPAADQNWSAYVRSMLAFSLISVLFLYGLERL
jgi:potassium-transporting ATPase potassium-binding subunit